jgi:histone H3/H4
VSSPDTGGLLRKSAVRRWLKKEFDVQLQIREAFFAAMESKVADDLRRSVARARELKRSTLMAPDV